MQEIDIDLVDLLIGSSVFIIPLMILFYYKTLLVRDSILAFLRMGLQLSFVGIYLKFIFDINEWWLNALWILLIMVAAAATIISRVELKMKIFFLPVLLSLVAGFFLNCCWIAYVLGSSFYLDARYLIPVAGMLLGNGLTSAIIGIRSFHKALSENYESYKYNIICGATKSEALFPLISSAMKDAFSPTIANTASIGLIWLPGMMVGQLLGGSDPGYAIKYQVLVLLAVYVGSVVTVILCINFSRIIAFDDYDMMKPDIGAVKKKLFRKNNKPG